MTTSYNICCKVDPNFFLTVKNDTVVFAPANENDENQKWYVHRTGSSFAVVHKVTGKAIKPPPEPAQNPAGGVYVSLIAYSNNDTSILWTERDVSNDGYRKIIAPLSSKLPFWHPWYNVPKDGIRLETYFKSVVNGDLLWKFIPRAAAIPVRIGTKLQCGLFMSVRNGKVVLATSNISDGSQQWYLHKSKDGSSFVVVNKTTGQAIKRPQPNQPLELVSNFSMEDASLKWIEHEADGEEGYTSIKTANDSPQVWDVEKEVKKEGTQIIGWNYHGKPNQRWMITY